MNLENIKPTSETQKNTMGEDEIQKILWVKMRYKKYYG